CARVGATERAGPLAVGEDLLLGPVIRALPRGVTLVGPGRDVVAPLGGVVTAEEPVVEAVPFLHDEGGVRVVADIVVVDEVVLEHVADEAAEEGGVRPGPEPRV